MLLRRKRKKTHTGPINNTVTPATFPSGPERVDLLARVCLCDTRVSRGGHDDAPRSLQEFQVRLRWFGIGVYVAGTLWSGDGEHGCIWGLGFSSLGGTVSGLGSQLCG